MNNTDSHGALSNHAFSIPQQTGDITLPKAAPQSVEDQLADVITSAREIAIVAEELLREFSARETVARETLNGAEPNPQTPHAIALAPRLLAATQQQLTSLMVMLRTV